MAADAAAVGQVSSLNVIRGGVSGVWLKDTTADAAVVRQVPSLNAIGCGVRQEGS